MNTPTGSGLCPAGEWTIWPVKYSSLRLSFFKEGIQMPQSCNPSTLEVGVAGSAEGQLWLLGKFETACTTRTLSINK